MRSCPLLSCGDVAPDWWLGPACAVGGLVGGYLGSRRQRCLPETVLRLLLGIRATSVGGMYGLQALT